MKAVLQKYTDIIRTSEIAEWDREPLSHRFKADIFFMDGSVLQIRDYLFSSGKKSVYHWQSRNGELIARWDSAPRWKEPGTRPFHRHETGDVFPSKEMTLDDVLKFIRKKLKQNS